MANSQYINCSVDLFPIVQYKLVTVLHI